MKKYLLLISGLILCGQFFWILSPSSNSRSVKPEIPNFSLPSLYAPDETITRSDLKAQNIKIINFFASWCGPCIVEHPLLMDLQKKNLQILGINYQDEKKAALMFLQDKGNPYTLSGQDITGLNWRVESIPQTFVINDDGEILYHKSGRILPEDIAMHILPLVE